MKVQNLSWLRRLNTSCEDNQAKSSVTQLFSSFWFFSPMNDVSLLVSYGKRLFVLSFDNIWSY